MSVPTSHIEEAEKLTADALVDLYTMALVDGVTVFRFKNNDTVTWQGNVYEGLACKLSGDARSADGEEQRASLSIMNPLGIFNMPAIAGDLDMAVLTRKRLLREHVDDNVNIFQQRMWYVGQVKDLISGQSITFQLRNMTEGPNFQIPVRMYTPPEFPLVTL